MMTSRNYLIIGIILAAGLAGIFVIGVIGMSAYRFFNPYLDVQISGPTTISSEWIEITPRTPLEVRRDRQHLMLDVEPPVMSASPGAWGLWFPDKTVVVPQVQLVDLDGKVYDLHLATQSG